MIRRGLHLADGLLRAEPWAAGALTASGSSSPLGRRLLMVSAVMAVFGMAYGAVMGTFGGVTPDRFEQMLYSAAKVPFLLGVTFALSLPSFFVINTLIGLRDDFGQVVRALVATQAGLTVVLASLAPITAVWYLSVPDYGLAKLFNAAMFGVASVAGQVQLKHHYRPLIQRNPRHRWAMRGWLLVYAFVGIQLAWVLRPFIGAVDLETTFFRPDAWTNAYVEVARLIGAIFGG